MRVLVTGSRDFPAPGALWEMLDRVRPGFLVLGDCPSGVDAFGLLWAQGNLLRNQYEVHRADWTQYGKAAGPLRNRAMAVSGADLCLAMPLGVSRGTRDCMRQCEMEEIPVYEFRDGVWTPPTPRVAAL